MSNDQPQETRHQSGDPTLTEFLLARIAEDETAAKAATRGPWYWEEPSTDAYPMHDQSLRSSGAKFTGGGPNRTTVEYDETVLEGWGYDASGIEASDEDRAHIARHDPARVLRECEAKRRIVETHIYGDDPYGRGMRQGHHNVLIALATVYADHPDYRDEWRP